MRICISFHCTSYVYLHPRMQVVTLCLMPTLMDDPSFPEDAKARARLLLKDCKGGSLGAYSDSAGIEIIRHHVADYITKRDGGIHSSWENIVLCAGASEGIKVCHQLHVVNCCLLMLHIHTDVNYTEKIILE